MLKYLNLVLFYCPLLDVCDTCHLKTSSRVVAIVIIIIILAAALKVKHCAKCFTYSISCNPHNSQVKLSIAISISQRRMQGSEGLSYLPKVKGSN